MGPPHHMADFIGSDAGNSFIKAAILDLGAPEPRHMLGVSVPRFPAGLPLLIVRGSGRTNVNE